MARIVFGHGLIHALRQVKNRGYLIRRRFTPIGWTAAQARRRGVSIPDNASIYPTARVAGDVTIGEGSFINIGALIDPGTIIGTHVAIGPDVHPCTGTHEMGPRTRRAGRSFHVPVVVGDGVWIGARAIVLPGVTVATGCVIGAGAVVTKGTEPDGVYLGNPARRIRDLP